jgi:predicted protein tyrosine phosphatase
VEFSYWSVDNARDTGWKMLSSALRAKALRKKIQNAKCRMRAIRSIERGLLVHSTYALISIRDTGAKRARIPKPTALRCVLHLMFDDAEPSDAMPLPPEVKAMSRSQARQIWRFVDRHKAHVGAFVVHCHQGMSRSPAVAAALAVYLGLDEQPILRKYQPNRYVYDLMRRTMPGGC